MDLKKTYGTDKSKEENGVWTPFGDECDILIARIGNAKYKKIWANLVKPHRVALRAGTLSEDIVDKLLIEVIAKAVVLDWRNMEEDGVEVVYSEEEAIRILTEYPDLREAISGIANTMEAFKMMEQEEAEKN